MSWEFAAGYVFGKPAELNCVQIEREWKRRKDKMEKASRRSWAANENSPRAMQLRENDNFSFLSIFFFFRTLFFEHSSLFPSFFSITFFDHFFRSFF